MARVEKLTTSKQEFTNIAMDLLVIGYSSEGKLTKNILQLDEKLNSSIKQALELEGFEGKKKTEMMVYGNSDIKRILIAGLGKSNEYCTEAARNLGARLVAKANKLKVKELHLDAESLKLDDAAKLQALAEGLVLGGYEFKEYKSEKKANTLTAVTFLNCHDDEKLNKALKISTGVSLARDVSNHPPNVATPEYLAEVAEKFADYPNMDVEIIDESEFEKIGMGAFYGVARGSVRPAKMILINYNGAGNKTPFALVGKGLTFDSGGISLKPGANMDEMKFDMCGSATVLGVMKAVGELQPGINIIAAIGATENMPGGNAQLPGDIVKAYNGKTIEILNTDAEGRLVLADVLSYVADKYKPEGILDFATLTGAVLIALGHKASGIMGNNDDLISEVKKSADITGEKVWELPLWDVYAKDVESKIADLKNMGTGRMSGSIAAGSFLKEFVGGIPWCHMDIAGTAWGVKGPDYMPETGATGVAVRLVYNLLENRIK
ncbi:MAG: leucyl aminopeptidase [Candidatus Marinimicrobia bacterium]|jgi:leucyl aminopeptidase|nr:leucyl aminopeptidase [Candidatus Neomarinimicrobiota bacterium]MBT3634949.1 leucyl aminopeptidase [Candidatus Neomarinimicrobiota bacterium]MBT3683765.1 leucyl aminopeptidase [Candidatus Neomarinimicrobiota bacterium]MBT3760549.1 leucyl aminopeptidase [Candidatus Neomarinimicrobiota bacterium]MBT3896712.1 leucyl aminopeptidase [Candidatus Neomarinimicrobiota bacterium]